MAASPRAPDSPPPNHVEALVLFLFLLLPVGLLLTLRGLERYERLLDPDSAPTRSERHPAVTESPHPTSAPTAVPATVFLPTLAGSPLPEPVSEAV